MAPHVAFCLLLPTLCLARGPWHVLVEVARLVSVLELDGGVGDAELALQHLPQAVRDSFAFGSRHVEDLDVARESVGLGAERPDVDAVDFAHTLDTEHSVGHASD